MSNMQITAIKAFEDNYIWCIHDEHHAVVVDPGEAEPVLAFLDSQSLELSEILITHHHYDHTGGIAAIKEVHSNVPVIGPANEKIKGLTKYAIEGDKVSILQGRVSFDVLETPGHTLDHIVFYNATWLFCGDTIFSAGCGRMFEGEPDMFLRSLDKLAALPQNLKVYCTHEYTLANVAFARHLSPEQTVLREYEQWAEQQRENDRITLPSTLGQELIINPFMRCHDVSFQKQMAHKLDFKLPEPTRADEVQNGTVIATTNHMKQSDTKQSPSHNAVATFAAVRRAKDSF